MYHYKGVYCRKDQNGTEVFTRAKVATEKPEKISVLEEILFSLVSKRDKLLTKKDCIRIVRYDLELLQEQKKTM